MIRIKPDDHDVRLVPGKYAPVFSWERYINCKRCTQVCPHGIFAERAEHAELARPAACMEWACAGNCPVQAIAVQSGVGCAWAMIGASRVKGDGHGVQLRRGGRELLRISKGGAGLRLRREVIK